jgi:phosphatidate cytidylyltransferase
LISFTLYVVGLVGFVLSLQKPHYRYQFRMFAWCNLTILIVVMQSSFILMNILQGLIWFILPSCLIIFNDTWAYVCGFSCGRTPLISLSPKKTWEGFLGAMVITVCKSFFLARFLAQFQFLICPKLTFDMAYPTCEAALPYLPVPYALPGFATSALSLLGCSWTYVTISPIQWHAVIIALFSSWIAPFGGFFASGFKRAFGIKDFGESIPGHGGVTDRMDCQIMMGLFTYVYYWTFIHASVDVELVMRTFALLTSTQQVELYHAIKEQLQL